MLTQFIKNSPVNISQFLMRQFFFLLPLLFMLTAVLIIQNGRNPVEVFPSMYHVFGGQIHRTLIWFSKNGNMVLYIVYLTIFGLSIKLSDAVGKKFFKSFVLIQISFTCVCVLTLKLLVGEPRPFTGENDFRPFSVSSKFHSFPSGHTAEITSACGPFAQYAQHYGFSFMWGLIPAVMGFSRIYLGQHYALDVFCGAIIGSIATYAILYLTLWWVGDTAEPQRFNRPAHRVVHS